MLIKRSAVHVTKTILYNTRYAVYSPANNIVCRIIIIRIMRTAVLRAVLCVFERDLATVALEKKKINFFKPPRRGVCIVTTSGTKPRENLV